MRIGVTTFGCDAGRSGIGRYAIHILRELSADPGGHTVEVMGLEEERESFLPEGSPLTYLPLGPSIRKPLMNLAWHQVALPRWARRRGYDVLFLPAANRRVPLAMPCPTVGTVHDFSSLHVKGKYDPARTFYIKKVLPFLVRRLTRVIAPSESSKRDIVSHAKVPAERVHVIPHGVDRDRYRVQDSSAAGERVARKYGVRPPYFAYTSRLEHPGKNHVRLIRAYEMLRGRRDIPHQLVLAGSDWSGAEEIHRVIRASPYRADILTPGFLPTEDLPDLYSGSEGFVFPSLFEGFGMPILEAMASGVPVACSDVSSLPEVAGDAAVLFDPGREESIAEAMEKLMNGSPLREEMIRKGLRRSRESTWAAAARRTLEVLEAVA